MTRTHRIVNLGEYGLVCMDKVVSVEPMSPKNDLPRVKLLLVTGHRMVVEGLDTVQWETWEQELNNERAVGFTAAARGSDG